MWRFLVFVKREADAASQRVNVGRGWSMDETEARTFDEPLNVARGMVQALYAVLPDFGAVNEWGADSDGDDVAPAWAAELLTATGHASPFGSWVEVDGEPFAFVAVVSDSAPFGHDESDLLRIATEQHEERHTDGKWGDHRATDDWGDPISN